MKVKCVKCEIWLSRRSHRAQRDINVCHWTSNCLAMLIYSVFQLEYRSDLPPTMRIIDIFVDIVKCLCSNTHTATRAYTHFIRVHSAAKLDRTNGRAFLWEKLLRIFIIFLAKIRCWWHAVKHLPGQRYTRMYEQQARLNVYTFVAHSHPKCKCQNW